MLIKKPHIWIFVLWGVGTRILKIQYLAAEIWAKQKFKCEVFFLSTPFNHFLAYSIHSICKKCLSSPKSAENVCPPYVKNMLGALNLSEADLKLAQLSPSMLCYYCCLQSDIFMATKNHKFSWYFNKSFCSSVSINDNEMVISRKYGSSYLTEHH